MKTIKLFQVDRRVRKFYYTTEPECCQRSSNNSEPKFTDVQAVTIYLYGIILGFATKTAIYNFAKQYLLKYCKHLPSYKQFCLRINKLTPFFSEICTAELEAKAAASKTDLLDSAPITVAKGSRSSRAKTAGGSCDKGWCASKKMWYYGVKIHILGEERPGSIPLPREIMVTKASEHDLSAGKRLLETTDDTELFADKAFIDDEWGYDLQLYGVQLNTPFKERSKNQPPLDDGERAWNAMVSSRRQPIESLFSQISRLTGIQNASFVRSDRGLFSFIWARLAVMALLYW